MLRRTLNTLRLVALLVLPLILLWRGLAAGDREWARMERRDLERRQQEAFATLDERYALVLGRDIDAFHAIMRHCPADATLAVFGAPSPQRRRSARLLSGLIYPRRLELFDRLLARFIEDINRLLEMSDRLWVLSLAPEASLPRPELYEEVESGEHFRLYRLVLPE